MKHLCFFHAGCPDGFGAAWAVWRAWRGDGRFVPRSHEDAFEPGRYEGDFVVFVDISLPNDLLHELGAAASQVVVLDHHLSARDQFASDPSLASWLSARGHQITFDLDHSGAILAWERFHADVPPPELLRYVEDQDLWKWQLPRSEEVNAAIGSHPLDFAAWDRLADRRVEDLADEGAPVLRANRAEVERALANAHPVWLAGQRAEAVNALRSRAAIGHELAKRAAFGQHWGVVYRVTGRRVDCSIYSTGSLDVSKFAVAHGGGGHRNAAGFSVSLEDWLKGFV